MSCGVAVPGQRRQYRPRCFITADIDIAFPESPFPEFQELMVGLWKPDFGRDGNRHDRDGPGDSRQTGHGRRAA